MEKSAEKKTAAKTNTKDLKKKSRGKFTQFFKDLKSEVKKVVWPNKKQIKNNTVVVLCFMGAAAVFIWGIDYILTLIVNLVFGG